MDRLIKEHSMDLISRHCIIELLVGHKLHNALMEGLQVHVQDGLAIEFGDGKSLQSTQYWVTTWKRKIQLAKHRRFNSELSPSVHKIQSK
jgi:hypothetical protein